MSRRSARRKRRAAAKQRSARNGKTGGRSQSTSAGIRNGKTGPSSGSETRNPDPCEEIRGLLSSGKVKQAVEAAKAYHKDLESAESEALLVDAYHARIQAMVNRGMHVEAKALVDLVCERYPSGRALDDEYGASLSIRGGDLRSALVPLTDPELPPDRRLALETALKRNLTDLEALALCDTLRPEHPLRSNAQALARAFEAVTSGPVEEEDIELREVSRRSPLAPWKALIRAIACFHEHRDEECGRWLAAIDLESAPARLVAPIQNMMGGLRPSTKVTPSLQLARLVGAGFGELQQSLRRLDDAFSDDWISDIFGAIEKVVATCKRYRPAVLKKLSQHIAVRCFTEGMPMDRVALSLDRGIEQDAHFWLLVSRSFEAQGAHLAACAWWEQFRRHAVHEGWFEEEGVEVATLYLHMAHLLESSDPDRLDWKRDEFVDDFADFSSYYDDALSPDTNEDYETDMRDGRPYYLQPNVLYERACEADPAGESFHRWRDYLRSNGNNWKEVDAVSLRWREKLPNDPQPLLDLMESAEKRNAFQKALKYLTEAEELDGLDPNVRRARVRLLAAIALRHVKERKPHLLMKDFEELEALPQMKEGDRLAFSSAIRWLSSVACEKGAGAGLWQEETTERLGGDSSCSTAVLVGLSGALDLNARDLPLSTKVGEFKKGELAEAVCRAAALGRDMGVGMVFPSKWDSRLASDLKKRDSPIGPEHLRVLAETALAAKNYELGYVASGVGLRRGDSTTARFLFLRSQCLRDWELLGRREECLRVAADLAQRNRQMDLLDEIMEASHGRGGSFRFLPWGPFASLDDLALPSGDLDRIVKRESRAISPDSQYDPFYPRQRSFDPLTEGMKSVLDEIEDDSRRDQQRGRRRREESQLDDDDPFAQADLFDFFGEDEFH